MARVCLLYLGQIRNPKNVLKHLRAELDESAESHYARALIDRAYLSIDQAMSKGTMLSYFNSIPTLHKITTLS